MKNSLTPNSQPPTSYAGLPCSVSREPCFENWYVDQRRTGWDAMFTFSGKERDQETGYGYFGARYYDSDISIWLSVDPMAGKYPSLSPYVYCANNPVKLVDPDGREPILDLDGNFLGTTVDDNGKNVWTGKPIVMDKDNYKEGMNHSDALASGTELDKHGEGIKITDETWNDIESNGGSRMQPTLENNSDATVYYKPEGVKDGVDLNPGYDANGSYPVGGKKDLYVPIDGVKTNTMRDYQVCKIPDGFRVRISQKGVPNIINLPLENGFSIIGKAGTMPSPNGGWDKLRDSFLKQ